jgi:hypothetical protein
MKTTREDCELNSGQLSIEQLQMHEQQLGSRDKGGAGGQRNKMGQVARLCPSQLGCQCVKSRQGECSELPKLELSPPLLSDGVVAYRSVDMR